MEDLLIQATQEMPADVTLNSPGYAAIINLRDDKLQFAPLIDNYLTKYLKDPTKYSLEGLGQITAAFYDTRSEARDAVESINSVIARYDALLMKKLDANDPSWLENYLAQKGLGIYVVVVDQELNRKTNIEDYLNKKLTSKQRTDSYHRDCETAQQRASHYTEESFIEDIQRYAKQSFTVDSYSEKSLHSAITQSLQNANGTTTHILSHLPDYSCQVELQALRGKFLEDTAGKGEQYLESYTGMYKIMSEFTGMVTFPIWDELATIFSEHLYEHVPNLNPITDHHSGPIDYGFLPFSGGDSIDNLNVRLHPSNINYAVEAQGSTPYRELGGAFAAYYLKILEAKHEHNFRQGLYDYSKDMNYLTMGEDITNIITQTRPRPFSGESKAISRPVAP